MAEATYLYVFSYRGEKGTHSAGGGSIIWNQPYVCGTYINEILFVYILTLEISYFQSEMHIIILQQSRDLPDYTNQAKGKQMTEASEKSM